MEQNLRHQVGRAAVACPPAGAPASGGPDKWQLLDLLGEVRGDFSLSHRELAVLRALLSFLPGSAIGPGAAVVFPSNASLAQRLGGIPESTLRRQLGNLVRAGIVSRHDSPNGKRYARRDGQGALVRAFGFDLAPLAALAPQLATRSRHAQAEARELALLREDLALLRLDLETLAADDPLIAEARRLLRRVPQRDALSAMCERIRVALAGLQPDQVSTSDSQNERHIQRSEKDTYNSNSACGELHATPPDDPKPGRLPAGQGVSPGQVAMACPEAQGLLQQPMKTWHDVVHAADRLAPMMGIAPPVLGEARQVMGPEAAAATVLCMLQRFGRIANPGGYLRRLTAKAREGSYSADRLVMAMLRPEGPGIVS